MPTIAAISKTALLAQPLSAWLGLSAQKLINAVGSWPQAVQFRDGLSQIFNGDVYLDPSVTIA